MALSVATILVAVFVFHADLHATAGPIFVVNPCSLGPGPGGPSLYRRDRALPVSSAVSIRITVAMHSSIRTHFAVVAALTIIVAAAHAPVATHLTIICPRLVALASLIPLLLGIPVRLGRNRLRRITLQQESRRPLARPGAGRR